MSWKYFVWPMLMCFAAMAKNLEPLSVSEEKVLAQLDRLQWREQLSDADLSFITNALCSPKDTISESALLTAAVHSASVLREIPEGRVGPSNGYSRLLLAGIIEGLKSGKTPIASLQAQSIGRDLPDHAQEYLRGKVNHILAVATAKAFREGKVAPADSQKLKISEADRTLLHYSKMPAKDSINDILERLTQAKVAGGGEYELVNILLTYENIDINDTIDALKHERITLYGKILIMSFLELRALLMTNEEKESVIAILSKITEQDERASRAFKRLNDRLKAKS